MESLQTVCSSYTCMHVRQVASRHVIKKTDWSCLIKIYDPWFYYNTPQVDSGRSVFGRSVFVCGEFNSAPVNVC